MNTEKNQSITESVLGLVDWESPYCGKCECPGRDSHLTPSRESDCRVHIDRNPVIHCFHASCEPARLALAEVLRKKLPKTANANSRSLWCSKPRKPETVSFDPSMLAKVASRVNCDITRAWLEQRSPIPVEDIAPHEALEHIYAPGERVLIFTGTQCSQGFLWYRGRPLARTIAHPDGAWFQNQPVNGKWYPKHGGGTSRRGAASVTSWRFMVIESDVAEEDQWLRLLVQLPLPICAIYTSGGKSIHALVRIDAESQEQWKSRVREWKPLLTRLGADPQSLTSIRNTRLPQAFRGETRQRLLYLNPKPTQQPIYGGAI